ncbi:cyclic nucleotide-binding domain protein (macronuclear) [Tetrahymena thermophila SB210]|uniref:Cyclic nucleotide-binding domain protein n=1 Tax=Tetrahymena thermophila (strain SB210) TaxID=312017 RepID=Q22BF0_TETTS|nr:cyclic nucleotide-binding domain protein [Tetrahymena thermophila SB210]EAR82605.2 cyclic nucleotide-binding domain protein [Tetrahymena thermophila SB210]|eukprot:XP_001030268.2 cyclic nucleotide-binding domain protein [Tetrahymena thermophila SB210]
MKKMNYKSISQLPQTNSKEFLEDRSSSQKQIIKQGDQIQSLIEQNSNCFQSQIKEKDQVWQQAQKDNLYQNTQGEEDDYLFLQTNRQNNEQNAQDTQIKTYQIQKSRHSSKISNKNHSMSIKSKHKEDHDIQNEQNQLGQNLYSAETPDNKNKLQQQLSDTTNQIDSQSTKFLKRNRTLLQSTQHKDDEIDNNIISPISKEQQQQNKQKNSYLLKQQSNQQGNNKIILRNGKTLANSPSIKNNKNIQRLFASNIYSNQTNLGEISDILDQQQASDVERGFVMDQSDGFYSAQKKQPQQKSILNRILTFTFHPAQVLTISIKIGLQHLNDNNFKSWLQNYNIENEIWQVRYNYSLYYSFITMITIGYGDIAPQNSHERIACIAFALTSSIIFSFSINTIGNIFQDYFIKFQFQLQMRYNAIKFLSSRQIDKNLQLRILKYIEYIHEIERDSPEKGLQIMNQVSEELKTQVFQDYYGKILQQNKYFSLNYSKSSILKLSLHVKEKMFAPGEILFEQGDQDGRLYYIIKGDCEFYLKGKEGSKNIVQLTLFQQTNQQFFGYKGFISGIPRELSCRSKNVSHVFYIQREDLINILKQDPQDYEKFCKIKDEFLFYTNSLGELCFACKNFGHTLTQCNRIHYAKNRSLLIQKYNYCGQQQRKPHQRNKNKYKSVQQINNVNLSVLNYKKGLIIDFIKEDINSLIVEQYVQFLQQESIDKVQELFPYLEFQQEGVVLKNQSDQMDSENELYTESDQSNTDTGEENYKKQPINSIQEMIEDNLSQQNTYNNSDNFNKNQYKKNFKNEQNNQSKQNSLQILNEVSYREIQEEKLNLIKNRKEEDNKSLSVQDNQLDKSNSYNQEKMQINKSIDSINQEIIQNQKQELQQSQQQFFEQNFVDINEIVEDDFNSLQNQLLIVSPDIKQTKAQTVNHLNNDDKQSIGSSNSSIKDEQRIQNYYKKLKQQQSEKIISQEFDDSKINKQMNQLYKIKIQNKSITQNQRLEEGVDQTNKYLHKKSDQKHKIKSSLKNFAPNHRQTKKDFSDLATQINQGLTFISKFNSTQGVDLNSKEKRFSQLPKQKSFIFFTKDNFMEQKRSFDLETQNQQQTMYGLQKISKQSNSQNAHSKFYQQRELEQYTQPSMKNCKSFVDCSEFILDQDKNQKDKLSKLQDRQSSKYQLYQKFTNQLADLYILDFETLKEYKNYFPHNNASTVCKYLNKHNTNNLISQKKLNIYPTLSKFYA